MFTRVLGTAIIFGKSYLWFFLQKSTAQSFLVYKLDKLSLAKFLLAIMMSAPRSARYFALS